MSQGRLYRGDELFGDATYREPSAGRLGMLQVEGVPGLDLVAMPPPEDLILQMEDGRRVPIMLIGRQGRSLIPNADARLHYRLRTK